MRVTYFLLLLVATASAATDIIQLYQDSAFSLEATSFSKGSVYIKVSDGVTKGGERVFYVFNQREEFSVNVRLLSF